MPNIIPLEKIESFCDSKKIPFHVPINEFESALKNGEVLYFSDNIFSFEFFV